MYDSVRSPSRLLFLHLVIYVFKGIERSDGVAILWHRELVELVKKVLCGHLLFGVVQSESIEVALDMEKGGLMDRFDIGRRHCL